MPRYPEVGEWLDAYERENPGWVDRLPELPIDPAWRHRKTRLLCDEQLEAEFVDYIRKMRGVRVIETRKRSDDHDDVWNRARRDGAVILTADDDFWDERKHPTSESPGLIVVGGRGADARQRAFLGAWNGVVGEIREIRKERNYLAYSKIRAMPSGSFVMRILMRNGQVSETRFGADER